MACRGSIYAWHRAIVGTAVAAIHEITASVANDPGQARAGTPDVWDLLQDGDVLEFNGDEDSLGDDYEEAADAYDDAVDGRSASGAAPSGTEPL